MQQHIHYLHDSYKYITLIVKIVATQHNSNSFQSMTLLSFFTRSNHSMWMQVWTRSYYKLTYLLLRLEKLCFLLHNQPRNDEIDLTYNNLILKLKLKQHVTMVTEILRAIMLFNLRKTEMSSMSWARDKEEISVPDRIWTYDLLDTGQML